MNILFVAFDYPPLIGGIATLSYQVAKNMSAGEKILVIATAIKGDREFDKGSGLVTFRITNIKILREVVLFFVALYLIFKFKADVIYNLSWYPGAAVSRFVSILTGIPYVIHVHAMDYFEDRTTFFNRLKYNQLRKFIKKQTFDRAKKIIVVSNFMKDRMVVRGVDILKIRVVPNGVDLSRFMPHLDSKEIILKYKLENKKILLTISRLHDYKGHDKVIKTLPRLISKFTDIVYLIVGTGPYEECLRKLTDELKLDGHVIFTGQVDDEILPLYYNACDVFIMLSREIYNEAKVEGFGIVFLEASACGKPIIAGRSGGIEDAVTDKVTGILVDPLDQDEIESAAEKILSDKNYAEQLGSNGITRIKEEKLDWHNVSDKIREVLAEAKG